MTGPHGQEGQEELQLGIVASWFRSGRAREAARAHAQLSAPLVAGNQSSFFFISASGLQFGFGTVAGETAGVTGGAASAIISGLLQPPPRTR